MLHNQKIRSWCIHGFIFAATVMWCTGASLGLCISINLCTWMPQERYDGHSRSGGQQQHDG